MLEPDHSATAAAPAAPVASRDQEQAPLILVYHRVCHARLDNQYLSVSPENFAAQMELLASRRRVLPLGRLLDELEQGACPQGCAAVTFDDGYADNLHQALPVLSRLGVPATVFVTVGVLGDARGFWGDLLEDMFLSGRPLPPSVALWGRVWPLGDARERLAAHDEIRWELKSRGKPEAIRATLDALLAALSLPAELCSAHPALSPEELRDLAASPLVEIGAHGMTHARLSQLSLEEQRREICQSRAWLEDFLGRPVAHFAYPYGTTECYGEETKAILRGQGLTGIANIQASLRGPLCPQDVPRRLVRDWDAATFAAWLDADDAWRDALEARTVAPRRERLLRLLEERPPARRAKTADRPLRILHINTLAGQGGAAKSTERLTLAQRARGCEAQALVGLVPPPGSFAQRFEPEPAPELAARCQAEGLLYWELQGSHRLHAHPLVRQADVLHFQNLHGGHFNPFSVSGLSHLKPCVWTLRDMQALTGACAHAFDCERWRTGCGQCPDLKVYPGLAVDSTALLWRMKRLVSEHSRLTIVTPSRWLAAKVEKSLLGLHPVQTIVNATDTDVFRPRPKAEARERLGLPRDAVIVGAVAHGGPLENAWKGGAYTLEAMHALRGRFPELLFANVGGGAGAPALPHVLNIPHTSDENRLAEIYSALDLFLYTSLADTCPLVVIEALSCGLPVASFATGGVPELVRHGVDGLVTPYKDVAALVEAASALLERPELRRGLSRAARQGALERFRLDDLARRYEDVYLRAMEAARTPLRRPFPPGAVPDMVRTPAFLELEALKTPEKA